MTHTLLSIVSCLTLLGVARANDYYVDALNGDDLNGGTSPADAWRTLSHASATVPGPPPGTTHTIHLAPGLYDAALGESFPIELRTGIHLMGAGSADTMLDAGGAAELFEIPDYGDVTTRLEHMWLRNADRGIDGYGVFVPVSMHLQLEDVVITDMTSFGIRAGGYNEFDGDEAVLIMRHSRIEHCGRAIQLSCGGDDAYSSLEAYDSAIIDNGGPSLVVGIGAVGLPSWAQARIERCRLERNHGPVIRASSELGGGLYVEDSLIVGNVGDVVYVSGSFFGNDYAELSGCTIADNRGTGVRVGASGPTVNLVSCILYNNVDDVDDAFGGFDASYSDIGDGTLAGVNGNFAADPLFGDAAAGDYRLRFSSPCVDAADPAVAPGALDLAGIARGLDGDLDTLARADVGAFELAPLTRAGAASPGSTVEPGVWGPSGGTARLLLARGSLIDPPDVTPFGTLHLDRPVVQVLAVVPTLEGPPAVWPLSIPGNPSLVGVTFGLQSVVTPTVAPLGAGLSNALEIVVVP